LRRKIQAATERSAITAAPIPTPMPILAASVSPEEPESCDFSASDALSAAEADDVVSVSALVGTVAEVVAAADVMVDVSSCSTR
jgi:hypothetical protein